ncbi:MAG: hypothetical protein J0I06_02560 [Planctomycetes bacterium]|nr:hypothetical protein [Planctomycetota bacterium]
MTTSIIRTSLLFLGAVFAAAIGHGQPAPNRAPIDSIRPYYTAFPDIKPTRLHTVVKDRDGTARVAVEKSDAVPLPPLPVLAADAPPLRKVQYEQIRVGLEYLDRIKENARLGARDPKDVQAVAVAAEVFLIAAELEEMPAKRVAWYEARVRVLKEGEEFVHECVLQGTFPLTTLLGARFERLRAEADLLRLKAEVEKTRKPGK